MFQNVYGFKEFAIFKVSWKKNFYTKRFSQVLGFSSVVSLMLAATKLLPAETILSSFIIFQAGNYFFWEYVYYSEFLKKSCFNFFEEDGVFYVELNIRSRSYLYDFPPEELLIDDDSGEIEIPGLNQIFFIEDLQGEGERVSARSFLKDNAIL